MMSYLSTAAVGLAVSTMCKMPSSEHPDACVQELAEARRNRRQPTRMNGYGSRTSSPTRELDAVSPIHTPAASPAKPSR